MRVEVLHPKIKRQKLRVCAYCRVSTDDADQYKSFFTQIEHFRNLIKSNPEWEFAGVFADEAISGAGIEKRTYFQKMMAECRKGKIDRILTKSISRFARNTADMLGAVRELKSLGISVFFQKENIDTMTSEGELLLTVLSFFAQEELRNAAENIRWGLRQKFEDGKVQLDTNRFLGYDRDENGNLVINEEEAKIVRRIFNEYIEGKGGIQIANGRTADGIKTVKGKERGHSGTIINMLKNASVIIGLNQKSLENQGFQRFSPIFFMPFERQISSNERERAINESDWDCQTVLILLNPLALSKLFFHKSNQITEVARHGKSNINK